MFERRAAAERQAVLARERTRGGRRESSRKRSRVRRRDSVSLAPVVTMLRVAVVAEVEIGEQIDGQQADRHAAPARPSPRRRSPARSGRLAPRAVAASAARPRRAAGIGHDLVVGAAGDGVDRLAERAQRALIRELDGHDHRHADGDAEDGRAAVRSFSRAGSGEDESSGLGSQAENRGPGPCISASLFPSATSTT